MGQGGADLRKLAVQGYKAVPEPWHSYQIKEELRGLSTFSSKVIKAYHNSICLSLQKDLSATF